VAKKVKEVIWTIPAKQDLQGIYEYLSEISETIAYRQVIKILDKAALLEMGFNEIGQAEPLLEHTGKNYRYLVSGNYKIIHRIDDNAIHIMAVFDTRQNPNKLKEKLR